MNYYIDVWSQGDLSNYVGRINSVKQGTLHAHYDNGVDGKFRFGNVCSSYCEFDYYTDNAITVNIGDVFQWKYDTAADKTFQNISSDISASDSGGFGNVTVDGAVVIDDGNGNLTISNATGVTDDGNANVTIPSGTGLRTISSGEYGSFYVVSIKYKKNICHVTGYTAVYFLDVDYSVRLKQLKNSFPMTIAALFTDVCAYCGCSGSFSRLFANEKVNYFYSDGITARDVIRAIAELSADDTVGKLSSLTGLKTIECLRSIGSAYVIDQSWNASDTYIICPDNGTYYQAEGVTPATNVWYKENSLEIKNGEAAYDGVEYITSDGQSLGHYYDTVSPQNIYYITNNIILDNLVAEGMAHTFDYYAQRAFDGVPPLIPSLNDVFPYVVASVDIFPFRCPYISANIMTRLVDTDGTYYNLPIMALDITDDRVKVESYGEDVGTNEGIGGNGLSAALARISKLENKFIPDAVTATTDSNGNIALTLTSSYNVISAIRTDASNICTPFYDTGNNIWCIHVADYNGSKVANTSVTVGYVYYEV